MMMTMMMRQAENLEQLDQCHRADRSKWQNGDPEACKLVVAPSGGPQWTGPYALRHSGDAHERLGWVP
jgi:hypothetical protein